MNEVEFLEKQAIEAAIKTNWEEAIKINQKITKIDKKNVSAILRLAFAYFQLKDYKKAKKYYQQVLKIQPNNLVAKENIKKIKILITKKNKVKNHYSINLQPDLFLEIPGKTKTVKLINLGQKNLIAELLIGQEVFLKIKKRKVEIRTINNEYIGSLPDDLSKRLQLFIKAGSQYQAFIKESSINQVVVFIKEIKKSQRIKHYISFPEDLTKNINQIINQSTDEDQEKHIDDDLDEIIESEDFDEDKIDLETLADSLDEEDKIAPFFPQDDNNEEE